MAEPQKPGWTRRRIQCLAFSKIGIYKAGRSRDMCIYTVFVSVCLSICLSLSSFLTHPVETIRIIKKRKYLLKHALPPLLADLACYKLPHAVAKKKFVQIHLNIVCTMSHSAHLIYFSCTKSKHNRSTVSFLRVSAHPECRHQGILILTQAAPPN